MCGIIGFSGYKEKTFVPDKIVTLMAMNASERFSTDGTGFWSPKNKVVKSSIPPIDFFINRNIIEDSIFIGHVRKSTDRLDVNTHPFEYEDIVGCHNGTVTNKDDLCRKRNLTPFNYTIDSKVLIACINNDHNDNVLAEYEGTATVLYNNKKNKDTLVLFVDEEKEIFFGFIKNQGMYISSSEKALKCIGCEDVSKFDSNNIHSIKYGIIEKSVSINNNKRELLLQNIDLIVGKYVTPNIYLYSSATNGLFNEEGHILPYNIQFTISSQEWIFVKKVSKKSPSSKKSDVFLEIEYKNNTYLLNADKINFQSVNYTKNKLFKTRVALKCEKTHIAKDTTVYYHANDKNGKVLVRRGDFIESVTDYYFTVLYTDIIPIVTSNQSTDVQSKSNYWTSKIQVMEAFANFEKTLTETVLFLDFNINQPAKSLTDSIDEIIANYKEAMISIVGKDMFELKSTLEDEKHSRTYFNMD